MFFCFKERKGGREKRRIFGERKSKQRKRSSRRKNDRKKKTRKKKKKWKGRKADLFLSKKKKLLTLEPDVVDVEVAALDLDRGHDRGLAEAERELADEAKAEGAVAEVDPEAAPGVDLRYCFRLFQGHSRVRGLLWTHAG